LSYFHLAHTCFRGTLFRFLTYLAGTTEEKTEHPEGLLEALGVEASYVGKNRFDYLTGTC